MFPMLYFHDQSGVSDLCIGWSSFHCFWIWLILLNVFIELNYWIYRVELLNILSWITEYIELNYWIYWVELLNILNWITEYIELNYWIYWIELLNILNWITEYIELNYWIYWVELLYILSWITEYIEFRKYIKKVYWISKLIEDFWLDLAQSLSIVDTVQNSLYKRIHQWCISKLSELSWICMNVR